MRDRNPNKSFTPFKGRRHSTPHPNLPIHAINCWYEISESGIAKSQKERIYHLIKQYGHGLNSRQIAIITRIDRTSVTPRITELKEVGRIMFILGLCPYQKRVCEFYVIDVQQSLQGRLFEDAVSIMEDHY